MAFDEEQLAQLSNVNGFGLYRYDTLDALATVGASGYINNPDDHVNLRIGDLIDVVVWATSIRSGVIAVADQHVVAQVSLSGDVDLLSLTTGFSRALYSRGQWGRWTADNSTTVDDTGIVRFVSETDATSSLVIDDDGIVLQQNTSAVIDNIASINSGGGNKFRVNHLPIMTCKWNILQTTDLRFFTGFHSSSSPLTADDPPGISYGIQYSTSRPDTNFQFIMDDATTQTIVDSGIAADIAPHYTRVEVDSASSVKVTLLNSGFVEQASNTFKTDLPAATTDAQLTWGVRTLAAAVKSIKQFHATIVLRGV